MLRYLLLNPFDPQDIDDAAERLATTFRNCRTIGPCGTPFTRNYEVVVGEKSAWDCLELTLIDCNFHSFPIRAFDTFTPEYESINVFGLKPLLL